MKMKMKKNEEERKLQTLKFFGAQWITVPTTVVRPLSNPASRKNSRPISTSTSQSHFEKRNHLFFNSSVSFTDEEVNMINTNTGKYGIKLVKCPSKLQQLQSSYYEKQKELKKSIVQKPRPKKVYKQDSLISLKLQDEEDDFLRSKTVENFKETKENYVIETPPSSIDDLKRNIWMYADSVTKDENNIKIKEVNGKFKQTKEGCFAEFQRTPGEEKTYKAIMDTSPYISDFVLDDTEEKKLKECLKTSYTADKLFNYLDERNMPIPNNLAEVYVENKKKTANVSARSSIKSLMSPRRKK
jgi:hypothetical protein